MRSTRPSTSHSACVCPTSALPALHLAQVAVLGVGRDQPVRAAGLPRTVEGLAHLPKCAHRSVTGLLCRRKLQPHEGPDPVPREQPRTLVRRWLVSTEIVGDICASRKQVSTNQKLLGRLLSIRGIDVGATEYDSHLARSFGAKDSDQRGTDPNITNSHRGSPYKDGRRHRAILQQLFQSLVKLFRIEKAQLTVGKLHWGGLLKQAIHQPINGAIGNSVEDQFNESVHDQSKNPLNEPSRLSRTPRPSDSRFSRNVRPLS